MRAGRSPHARTETEETGASAMVRLRPLVFS